MGSEQTLSPQSQSRQTAREAIGSRVLPRPSGDPGWDALWYRSRAWLSFLLCGLWVISAQGLSPVQLRHPRESGRAARARLTSEGPMNPPRPGEWGVGRCPALAHRASLPPSRGGLSCAPPAPLPAPSPAHPPCSLRYFHLPDCHPPVYLHRSLRSLRRGNFDFLTDKSPVPRTGTGT